MVLCHVLSGSILQIQTLFYVAFIQALFCLTLSLTIFWTQNPEAVCDHEGLYFVKSFLLLYNRLGWRVPRLP
jgi:hypothetical protein